MSDWNLREAKQVYSIQHWGLGYVDINEQGRLLVRPDRDPQRPGVDLYRLAMDLQQQGVSLPVLLRFKGILRDRVDGQIAAFARASQALDYQGRFNAVYPIKVNQQRSVVEEILSHGGKRVGLEAGSKPELMAVLALADADGGLIICNGYKDREYIRMALIGERLGHRVYLVIEKPSELDIVLQESARMGVKPRIGIRLRLASLGKGKWQNTGGEKAKFGLSAAQVLDMVAQLREQNCLDLLQLMHFHMGSQIANIRDMQNGLLEAAYFFAELRQQGASLDVVDVGGGLGVDYDGTRSRGEFSINYTLDEYAMNVVRTFKNVCARHDLSHPDLVTESGRGLSAHHAVLIMNVIGVESVPASLPSPPESDDPRIIHDMWSLAHGEDACSALEMYHDAAHWLAEAQLMFTHGDMSLVQRAKIERIYHSVCHRVHGMLRHDTRIHREVLDELNEKLADKFFCNFSVFQSAPDVWGIKQVFPVVPLHRLDERPTRRAILQDLTCDSDGRIDSYVDNMGIESTLPVHPFTQAEGYYLGIFLVGAYQEILGDMHNLFGDTNSVDIEVDADGQYQLSGIEYGDQISDMLRYVHFDPAEIQAVYRRKMASANIEPGQRDQYLEELQAGLDGYTYLED